MSFWKTEGNVLLESVLTGAANQSFDKFYNQYPWRWNLAFLSAASAFFSGNVTDWVAPSVTNMSSSFQGLESTVLKPIVSGLLYAGADKFLHWDNRSLVYNILHQAGSQVVGSYLEKPIGNAIGL